MDFYSMTDDGITRELGARIRSLRLRKNITQQQLSAATTLSLNAIKALESGKGKLSTVIAVLRELSVLNELDSFIPESSISPLQLARMQGKTRQRASGKRIKEKSEGEAEW